MADILLSNPNRILYEGSNDGPIIRYDRDFLPVPGVASPLGGVTQVNTFFTDRTAEAINNYSLATLETLYSDDTQSVQGWTYVADYSFHNYYPNNSLRGTTRYLHARINKDNNLEFAFFNNRKTTAEAAAPTAYTYIFNKNVNKNTKGQLRIASKAESEAFMLTSDRSKIKISCLPKYAGSLQNETYTNNTPTGDATISYGHVWTYWYTIIADTLYFVGFPLYLKNDKGMCPKGDGTIVECDLPPNNFYIASTLEKAVIKDEEFYNAITAVKAEFLSKTECAVDRILAKWGDWTEPTPLQTKVLAKIEDGNVSDVFLNCDLVDVCSAHSSLKGGVYNIDGENVILNQDSIAFEYEEDRVPKITTGYSGFNPVSTKHVIRVREDITDAITGEVIYKWYYYITPAYYTTTIEVERIANSYSIELSEIIASFDPNDREDEVEWLEYKKGGGGGNGTTGVPPIGSEEECPPGWFMYKGECSFIFIYIGHNIGGAISFSA